MSGTEEDRKPVGNAESSGAGAGAAAGGTEHLNLKVKAQDGNAVYFKVKKTTQLRKLMEAYCKKIGADILSIRFLFDGRRIAPEETPEDLAMEDEDEIDAMVAQTGGFYFGL